MIRNSKPGVGASTIYDQPNAGVLEQTGTNSSDSTSTSTATTTAFGDPKSYIEILPDHILQNVLGNLDPTSLKNACEADSRLEEQARNRTVYTRSWAHYDPSKDFAIEVIDEKVWRAIFSDDTLTKHGLSFKDAEPLDGKALHSYLSGIDFNKIEGTGEQTGMALVTLPKGLTFNKLVALAGEPKPGGHVAKFECISKKITQDLRDIEVQKTYRAVLSKNILYRNTKQTYDAQQEAAEKSGEAMPRILEIATLPILKFMSAKPGSEPVRLFSKESYAFMRGSEKINGKSVSVGGFGLSGLNVLSSSDFDFDYSGNGFFQRI